MPEDHYENLGVEKDATPSDIKRAWRRKARELHPDKTKTEDTKIPFQKALQAYQVLSNSESRERYDKTGNDGVDALAAAEQFVVGIFSRLIDQYMNTGEDFNFIDSAVQTVKDKASESKNKLRAQEPMEKRISKIEERISVSEGDYNLFEMILRQKIDRFRESMQKVKDEIEMLDHALKTIELYRDGYIEPAPEHSGTSYFIQGDFAGTTSSY